MSEVGIFGYSERGIVNALLYEIGYHENRKDLFNKLLAKATFPFTTDKPPRGKIKVFVEFSFSRYFGDPDIIFFIDAGEQKSVVFVEAKVGETKRLCKRFDKFLAGPYQSDGEPKKNGHSSTIFMQVYHRQLIMRHGIEQLTGGLKTKEWGVCKERSLGEHKMVRDLAVKVKSCDNAFYLMLVPDTQQQADDFFKNKLKPCNEDIRSKLPDWDDSHCGYLAWETVAQFCKSNGLANTLAVFEYNGEQIYRRPAQ